MVSRFIPRFFLDTKLKHKLNSTETSQNPNSLEPENKTTIDHIIESFLDTQNAKVIDKNPGPYKGIAFKSENDVTEYDASYKFFNLIKAESFKKTRCYIPTFHDHLPRIPNWENCPTRLACLFPEFVGETKTTDPVKPGQIILCEFKDKENFKDPVYYKKVLDEAVPIDTATGTSSSTSGRRSEEDAAVANAKTAQERAKIRSDSMGAQAVSSDIELEDLKCDPLKNLNITDGFGKLRENASGVGSYRHQGVDLAATDCHVAPTFIYAVDDGSVVTSEQSVGGLLLTLNTSTYKVNYCHLGVAFDPNTLQDMKTGITYNVKAGDPIGIASNSGTGIKSGRPPTEQGAGTHLHLQIYYLKDGKLVAPERIVPGLKDLPVGQSRGSNSSIFKDNIIDRSNPSTQQAKNVQKLIDIAAKRSKDKAESYKKLKKQELEKQLKKEEEEKKGSSEAHD